MLSFKTPTDQEFQDICNYIHEFELDNRILLKQEFTAAFRDNKLVGFGRLREHTECTELCSLGVVAQYRRKGIGKALTAELIRKAPLNLYLVCIIPEFFIPFGFNIVKNFPSIIQNKLNYCIEELFVPEIYVVMKLF
ncbi:MAG: GNAT family N-acetyltransferase [Bacteroidetes bacterium]|nr:GNAT family N-acetyltransferase [Bacteroidota bacterium]